MLDEADDEKCAGTTREKTGYVQLVPLLPTPLVREWFELGKSAILAEIRQVPEFHPVEAGPVMVAKYLKGVPPGERKRLTDALSDGAHPLEACRAVRRMYRDGLSAPESVEAQSFVRWLAIR